MQSTHKKSVESLKEEVDKLESEVSECENTNKSIKSKVDELQKKQPISFSSHRMQQNETLSNQKEKTALSDKIQSLESKLQFLKKDLQ
jgi:polyhydroxyalkanoate synthesis regulator phasin